MENLVKALLDWAKRYSIPIKDEDNISSYQGLFKALCKATGSNFNYMDEDPYIRQCMNETPKETFVFIVALAIAKPDIYNPMDLYRLYIDNDLYSKYSWFFNMDNLYKKPNPEYVYMVLNLMNYSLTTTNIYFKDVSESFITALHKDPQFNPQIVYDLIFYGQVDLHKCADILGPDGILLTKGKEKENEKERNQEGK